MVGMGALGSILVVGIFFSAILFLPLKTADSSLVSKQAKSRAFDLVQPQLRATPSVPIRGSLSGVVVEILQLESDFDQALALYSLLSDADENTVRELLDQSKAIDQPTRRESILLIIFSKYATIDPRKALNEAQEYTGPTGDRLVSRIFRQWSRSDLDSAIASAKSLVGSQRETASRSILYARDDLDLERLYEVAEDLQNRAYMNFLRTRYWHNKALENPRSAWRSALLSKSMVENRSSVLSAIAVAWVDRDGRSALDEIRDSQIDEQLKTNIYEEVLVRIAETDLETALSIAIDLRMSPTSNTVRSIFSGFADENPNRLLDLADSMDQRFASTAKFEAIEAIAKRSPRQAVSMLSRINNFVLEDRAARTIATQWATKDPHSSLEWYATREPRENDRALARIMRALVDEGAADAFNTVTAYPGELGIRLTNALFGAFLLTDDVDAKEFLLRLDNERKLTPAIFIGSSIVLNDLNQALALSEFLPESGRKEYQERMIYLASDFDRFDLYGRLDRLPTIELKAYAAMELLTVDKDEGLFSNEQIQSLRSRLNDRQKEKVDNTYKSTSH